MVGILFAFKIIIFALCAGVVISVLVFVPLTLYVIPYALWVGSQNCAGKHKDKKKESIFRSARNATILYKSWITRKKPTL